MIFDIELEMQRHRDRLETILELADSIEDLDEKSRGYANSLIAQFVPTGTLSAKQWDFVVSLADRVRKSEPIYGDFNAIQVMFQLAGEKLKKPKIRLMSDDGVFVQLTFLPESRDIEIHRDGWQGHGKRRFCGWIRENMIVPYNTSCMDEDVRKLIHEFSLDPQAVSKAMANKLGVCIYCAHRLSDPISKRVGYGATCAKHYGLEWK